MIFAQSHLISVQSLYPAIEKLVKAGSRLAKLSRVDAKDDSLVEVVLTPAASMGNTRSITLVQFKVVLVQISVAVDNPSPT